MPTTTTRHGTHNWNTFVRPSVKTIPLTRQIIESVMPYFPAGYLCIGGYLNDSDQRWKVNYHWELLVYMIDKALALPDAGAHLTRQQRGWVATIRQRLMVNPPRPQKGYRTSKAVGNPADESDHETVHARWATLKQAKKDFGAIITSAGIPAAAKKESERKTWYLAVAPVAAPGRSNHGNGYALDIAGPSNADIKRISLALGATLAFDEQSHVHVEFAKGVKP